LESPLPYPLPTPLSWGEGIDQRHGGGVKMRPRVGGWFELCARLLELKAKIAAESARTSTA